MRVLLSLVACWTERQVRAYTVHTRLLESCPVTRLLEKAFEAASQLPAGEQDALAASILAEVQAERHWDGLFESSTAALSQLADEALHEHRAKRSLPFVPKDV